MNRNRELVPGSWSLIIILEVCKCPTHQNILTAQGAYKSRSSDNMIQHKIKFNKIHIYFIAHTHTHTHSHVHANRHACIDTGTSTGNGKFRSLVQGLRGIVWLRGKDAV